VTSRATSALEQSPLLAALRLGGSPPQALGGLRHLGVHDRYSVEVEAVGVAAACVGAHLAGLVPDADEARFFNLPPDGRVAVYEIFRTAFDQTDTPMRVTVTMFPTDRNQFIVLTGDVPEPQGPPSPEDHES